VSKRPGEAIRYSIGYFAIFTIYGVVSPYLQMLLRGLGYGPASIGLLLAISEIAGIAGPLVLTVRADSRRSGGYSSGSRRLLAGMGLCVLASLPGLAFATRPAATAVSLVLLAIGQKTMVPLMDARVVAYSTSQGRKLRGGYGSIRAPGTLGYICVTLALQFTPGFDSSPPWVMAACMGGTTLLFLAALFALPEPERATVAAGAPPRDDHRPADPAFVLGIVIIGLNRFAMAPVNSFLSIYASEELGLRAVGGIWALSAAAEIPLMLVASRIIARTGPMAAIALSSGAVIARLAMYAAFPSVGGIVAAQLLHSLCYGVFHPAAVAFVAERFPPERRATGMAIYMGIGVGLPAVLGSALGGYVVEAWGYKALFLSFTAFAWASLALYAATRKRLALRVS
jgi:PPP family 3-phenylpropionic acid transporter